MCKLPVQSCSQTYYVDLWSFTAKFILGLGREYWTSMTVDLEMQRAVLALTSETQSIRQMLQDDQ